MDDAKMIELFNVFGRRCSKIAAHFENRTQSQIKNRYNQIIKYSASAKDGK